MELLLVRLACNLGSGEGCLLIVDGIVWAPRCGLKFLRDFRFPTFGVMLTF